MQNKSLLRKGLILGIIMLFVGTSIVPGMAGDNGIKNTSEQSGKSTTDWWPMYRHDMSRSGYSTSTAPNNNAVLWIKNIGNSVNSSSAVVDGKVYVGSADNKVYCLNANTGVKIWEYTTGNHVDSSPAVAYGKVYVGSNDNKVYCLNANTGVKIWEYTTGDEVWSSPAVADGKVYISSNDNNVYCLDANNGGVVWTFQGHCMFSPAVVNGKVYVGSWLGATPFYCLNATTGAEIWSRGITTDLPEGYCPAVVDGKVFTVLHYRCFSCLNANTGAIIWEIYYNYDENSTFCCSPAVANGKVYVENVNAEGNRIYCLNANTGDVIWRSSIGVKFNFPDSSPVVADGKVYGGSGSGTGVTFCLDANTGATIWSYHTGDMVWSTPAVADGKVYISSFNGDVYCFGSSVNKPDLTVTTEDISIPNYMVENQDYLIKARVRNIGTAAAQNFNVQFLAWAPTANDWTILATYPWYQLDPGTSITMQTSFYPQEPGTYLIKVITDVYGTVDEINENNNEAITSANVLPVIGITPSRNYHIGSQTLDIKAIIHDNLNNQDITNGLVTWALYDSSGQQIQGYGGTSDPFVYNSDPNHQYWENLGNDMSGLTTGKTYTIKIYYMLNYPTQIEFLKASGKTWIHGYVYDKNNNPLINAKVNLTNPIITPIEIYTDSSGYYTFDGVPTSGYHVTASFPGLKVARKTKNFESDQHYWINFTLWDFSADMFKTLLEPLESSCIVACNTETNSLRNMMNKVESLSDHDWGWDIASAAGALMTGALPQIPATTARKIIGETASNAVVLITEETLKKGILRTLPQVVAEKFVDAELDKFLELVTKDLNTDIEGSKFWETATGAIEEFHADFKSQAPSTIDPNFDFTRAAGIRDYLSQQLNNINDVKLIVIPFDYEKPQDILFPSSKAGFDNIYYAVQGAGNTRKGCIIAQIGCGIAAIGLAVFTGGVSLSLLGVAHGIGVAGEAAGYGEAGGRCIAYISFGTSVGNYITDMKMIPAIMCNSSVWFLNEGNQPYYLDENKNFNIAISNYYYEPDYNLLGANLVFVPWNGGTASKPVTIHVTNQQNYEMNIYAQINDDRRTQQNVQPGAPWKIDEGDGDNKYSYEVYAYNPWTTFVPRFFTVTVHAGLPVPVFPSDSRSETYYVLPKLWKGSVGPETLLPLSTSKGRLSLNDTGEFYPREHLCIDTNLSITNTVVETNYTVPGNASSVEFQMFCPSSSIIDFSIYDSEGDRIGYNYSTDMNDVEFFGSCSGKDSNHQIITIPHATNKTYRVRTAFAVQYSDTETDHVVVKAFDIPERPAVLSLATDEIIVSTSPGTTVSVPIEFGEAGMYEALQNVSIEISNVEHDGVVLQNISNATVDVGLVLPGTGSTISFTLQVPKDANEGDYTGVITINASNAQSLTVNVRVRVSNPPEKPDIPSGPGAGVKAKAYTFSTRSVDPESDQVYYKWDWDDGTFSDWLGPFNSGVTVTASYLWSDVGEYPVKVLAKDSYGILSNWSEPLVVDIINASLLKKTWLFGLINNVNTGDDLTCFNASILLSVRFFPFSITPYRSSEKLIVSNDYLGKIGSRFIFGRFNAMVLSESSSSSIHPFRDRLKKLIAPNP